ncbi:MAG: hypothetical protein PVJ93_00380, partial [Pseudomonadales bacterium]
MAEIHPFPPALLARLAPFEGSFHAHKLAAEGAEVLLASYAAGEHIPAHDHPTENWGVVITGCLGLTCGAEPERLIAPGAWYHLAPGEA